MITIKKNGVWQVLVVLGSRIVDKWSFGTFREAREYAHQLQEVYNFEIVL